MNASRMSSLTNIVVRVRGTVTVATRSPAVYEKMNARHKGQPSGAESDPMFSMQKRDHVDNSANVPVRVKAVTCGEGG